MAAMCMLIDINAMAGFGNVTWWGFSPPLDLLEEIEIMNNRRQVDIPGDKELNVLLVGAADIRHVFKTIAQGWRHTSRKINFYVIENDLEVVCRDFLLLRLIAEPTSKMGFQEKMELFLEIYGNSVVRYQTASYIQNASEELKKIVTDLNYMEEKLPFLDLNHFRYKDRDSMDGIFSFWKNPDMKTFEITKYWEHRQRQYLGTRYDTRMGAYDWDYNMKLIDKGAGIINYAHYIKWRNSGVAFELRDGNYNVPNRTLASVLLIKRHGVHYLKRGYWGDIVTGPYIAAFGIECDDKTYFEKRNEMYRRTAQDVASRNVISLLHELVLHRKFQKHPTSGKGKADHPTKGEKGDHVAKEEEPNCAVKDPASVDLQCGDKTHKVHENTDTNKNCEARDVTVGEEMRSPMTRPCESQVEKLEHEAINGPNKLLTGNEILQKSAELSQSSEKSNKYNGHKVQPQEHKLNKTDNQTDELKDIAPVTCGSVATEQRNSTDSACENETVTRNAHQPCKLLKEEKQPPKQEIPQVKEDSVTRKSPTSSDSLDRQKGNVGGDGDQGLQEDDASDNLFKDFLKQATQEEIGMDIAKDISKNYRMIFLSPKITMDLHQRDRFLHLFNLVFYANSMVHVLKPEMKAILAPDAVLILETAKFLIELRNEQITESVGKLVSVANSMGCKAARPCEPKLDTFARFYYQMNEED